MTRKRSRRSGAGLLRAIARAGGRCCFCEVAIDFYTGTREHITPRSLGGSNRRENVTASCYDCNKRRGTADFDTFKANTKKRPDGIARKHPQKRGRCAPAPPATTSIGSVEQDNASERGGWFLD